MLPEAALPAPGLAVAILSEATETAATYRHDPARPLWGYLLVVALGEAAQVHLFLENARSLTQRRVDGAFYYEGWLVSNGWPVSLGVVNTSNGGEAVVGSVRPLSELALHEAKGVRVTAEPFGGSAFGHTPVLAGTLVWLHGGPAVKPEAEAPVAAPELKAEAPAARVEASAEAPKARAEAATEAAPVAAPELQPEMEVAAPVPPAIEDQQPMVVEAAAPALLTLAEMEAADATEAAGVRMEELQLSTEPPAAHSSTIPGTITVSVPLASRHPMAPRASGHALLQHHAGTLTVTMRGLPSPPSLGREPSTNRPYNAYRVWLVHHHTGARISLGHCTRVWGDNFRFDHEGGLPLGRYDTVLVTADDRTAPTANPATPQVLLGEYKLT